MQVEIDPTHHPSYIRQLLAVHLHLTSIKHLRRVGIYVIQYPQKKSSRSAAGIMNCYRWITWLWGSEINQGKTNNKLDEIPGRIFIANVLPGQMSQHKGSAEDIIVVLDSLGEQFFKCKGDFAHGLLYTHTGDIEEFVHICLPEHGIPHQECLRKKVRARESGFCLPLL